MLLSDTSIKRPVTTVMLIVAIIVFGLVSYPRIGVELMPNVEFPVATIVTIYPGADPETVEKEVSEKIEEALSNINGVRDLKSISAENISQVVVKFELEVPIAEAIQDVRDKVSRVMVELPADVETPKIEKLDMGAIPMLTLAVSGPGTIDEITQFARKRVKEQIQQLPGVGSIDIIGGQEREISVWIDPKKLETMGLSVNDVIGALKANNLKFPGGRLNAGTTEFSVKVDGEFKTVGEIGDMVVFETMGRNIRLKDVARIEDGLEERRSTATLSGQRSVTLVVRKQSGANAVSTGDNVKGRLDELAKGFPAGYKVLVAVDTTTYTKESINHVKFDLWFGALLAIVIIFLFLRNKRSTLISALALPTSIIGSFAFIKAMGFTFNTMSLAALSLSVGILVDDAIVVIENIFRHMEMGKSPQKAASDATDEIGLAVIATTMSIVAVFVPVAFMQGIVGRFFYQFGLSVTAAVLLSLVVSFTLTPMMSARYLKEEKSNSVYRAIERFLNSIDHWYRGVIAWALANRWKTVASAVVIFALSLSMIPFLGLEFQPQDDMGEFNVIVQMPTGSTLAHTEEVSEGIAKEIRGYTDLVTATVLTIGSDAQQKQNLAQIYVKLLPKQERELGQIEFMGKLRERFSKQTEATVSVEIVDWFGGSSGFRSAQIQLAVRGGDLTQLDDMTRKVIAELKKIPGFVDLDTTYEGGKPEVRIQIDRERAADQGVMTAMVGDAVRSLVGGVEASKFRENGEDYEIRVRLDEPERQNSKQIALLKVRSTSGRLIDVGNVAKIENAAGPTQIDRSARQRVVTVLGNLEKGFPLGQAMDKIREVLTQVLPPEMTAEFEGEGKFMRESFEHMLFSLFLAIIIVYMILASQFESFLHPFTIMLSLPLSLVGALGALLLFGKTMNIISMIGIIMLMGLVTKNAILLIDYTNTLRRRDGLDRTEALLKAGPTRLRPILMTTAAMIFGMAPMALSTGQGSEGRAPMAICVIGGLITSTVLTLVVVPVVYSLLDDIENRWNRRKGVAQDGENAV